MRGRVLSQKKIKKIISLRKTGHSLPEIQKITGKGSSTVFKYVKDVKVLPQYADILRIKQGGSKARSERKWQIAKEEAKKIIPTLTRKEKLLVLASLYWGEGTKRELNIINGDPELVRVSARCLEELGVKRQDFIVTIRIFEDMNKTSIVHFWKKLLKIKPKQIININILHGKKYGTLPYGMCRLRVRKAAPHFKLLMSMINLVKLKI